jgi:hypothetical protein
MLSLLGEGMRIIENGPEAFTQEVCGDAVLAQFLRDISKAGNCWLEQFFHG